MLARTIIIILYSVAQSMVATAQKSPLNNTWILFDQVSLSGPLYSNALPKMTEIKVDGDNIYFRNLDMSTQGLDTTAMDTCLVNKLYARQYRANRYKEVKTTWLTQNTSFESVTDIYDSPAKTTKLFERTDVYTLQGTQLVLNRKFKNVTTGDAFECKGIFEKREE